MPPPIPSRALARPHLQNRLGSDAACVVLCGPEGSGRTTALAVWAAGREDVVWCDGEGLVQLPDVTEGFLVIDDADGLHNVAWEELTRRLRRNHALRVRLSVHAVDVVPSRWDFDLVEEVQFSADEVGEFLTGWEHVADPRLVRLLTAGNPAAVRSVVRFGATSEQQIVGALARDRSACLPDDLMLLALPFHLNERIVAELGGPDDFLATAGRAGWGVWSSDPAERLFTLTAARRHATLEDLVTEPRREREIRSRMASILLAEGLGHAALLEAAAAGDVDLVDAAAKRGGMPMLIRHGYEVNRALALLPLRRIYRYPVVAFARALVLNANRMSRLKAVEFFGIAISGARSHPRYSSDRALMRVVESVAARVVGLGDGGLRAARQASEMLAAIGVEDRGRLSSIEPDLHVHTGISLYYGGDVPLAATEFENALVEGSRPGVQMQALGGLALIEVDRGDLPMARYWVDLAMSRAWDAEVRDGYAGSMLRIAQTLLAVEEFDVPAAHGHLEPVWQMVDTSEHWPLLAVTQALIDVCSGRAGEGLELLRHVRRHRTPRRGASAPNQRRLDVAESQLMLVTGDMAGARRFTLHPGDPPTKQLAAARIALIDGQDDKALELLRQVGPESPAERFQHVVMETVLLARLRRNVEASARVEEVRTLHRTYGLRSALMFVPVQERSIFGDLMDGVPEIIGEVASIPRLTPREQVVLVELARTENLTESAARLQVSVNTVKSQRRSLYRKLGATSRDDALATALAHRLLE